MVIKKIFIALIVLLLSFCAFSGCGQDSKESIDILFCYANSSADEFGGKVYESAINQLDNKGSKIVELGVNPDTFVSTLNQEVSKKNYKAIVIIGKSAYEGLETYIKSFKGMNFIALDCNLTNLRENLLAVEFSPEEFGFAGGTVLSDNLNAGFVAGYNSSVRNSFDNRILYGFLQALNSANASGVYVKYIEETSNVIKSMDYCNSVYSAGVNRIFDISGRSAYGSAQSAVDNSKQLVYGGVNLKSVLLENKGENFANTVVGGVQKNYGVAIGKIYDLVKNGFETGKTYELDFASGAFTVEGKSCDFSLVKKLNGNQTDFESLTTSLLKSENETYSPKYSVEAKYHEAVPSCADTNDWKYAPRAGSNNGMKPSGWTAVGIWATIYMQEGEAPVLNTGIEFQNMRLWAYTATSGWVLLEHANPTGSFYDENFSNDAHTSFISNYINYGTEKRTRIKLDYSTVGYNYHPFGSQISLYEKGLTDKDGNVINGDILYIFSEMDIRLCVWDSAVQSDIDDAKYVANIGADWWRAVGLSWSADWNNNKDVCVGQFRTITKEWKRLYMTNVPSNLYDQIFETFPFGEY